MSSQKTPVAAKTRQSSENSRLRKGLKTYGLDQPSALAVAIGVSRQHAHMILTGRRSPSSSRPYHIGVAVAKRIAAATGLPFTLILEWQDNGR